MHSHFGEQPSTDGPIHMQETASNLQKSAAYQAHLKLTLPFSHTFLRRLSHGVLLIALRLGVGILTEKQA